MGAKTQEQVNKSRSMVNCDICTRKFVNVQALKSHQNFMHRRTETARRLALNLKKQEHVKLSKKKVIPVNMLKRVNPPTPVKQPVKSPAVAKSPVVAGKDLNQTKKPHFECPVCFKKFPVYFSAFKHIQKNAPCCVDHRGIKVPANSENLVKPVRIEYCMSCKDETRSTEPHNCRNLPAVTDRYECLGCKQVFNGLLLFQHHVKGLHSDGAQSYYFPSRKEFTSWKTDVQEQTKVEFTQLNQLKTKEVYHCSFQPAEETNYTYLCPSMIIVREYSKGIQVSYVKDHYGHIVDTTPLKKYSEYTISLSLRETEEIKELSDDSDLYSQLKKIILSVVNDAAKADLGTLKELLGKALEMTTLLKGLKNNDHSVGTVKKKLSDDQIAKTLDSLPTKAGKRKPNIEIKEPKKDIVKRMKRNSVVTEDTVQNSLPKAKASPVTKSVTFKKDENQSDSELSQADTEDSFKTILKVSEKVQTTSNKADELSETSSVATDDGKKDGPVRSTLQSPSFNDSYMNFVDQNFKVNLETSTPKIRTSRKKDIMESSTPKIRPYKKKEVVKTKMGQFKATSLSPKEHRASKEVKPKEIIKESNAPKNWTTKDLKYEVKEQENDYNILILKI